MLLKSLKKDGKLWFEVCKEGLLRLKPFHTKKLRIIFNISHQKKNLHSFNQMFLLSKNPNNNNPTQQPYVETKMYSYLQISSLYEQLTDNRVVLLLNCFENSEQPQSSVQLVVLGYIIASVFFYHNNQPFSQNSCLTNMFRGLQKCLKATQILKLEQQITQKIGFSKKPYFMCLQTDKINRQQNGFCSFYKYREKEEKVSEAVDMLFDFFPERSGIEEINGEVLERLRKEFMQQILGRKIFNFEITGLTLENLCFELCQLFNKTSGSQKIDLVKIYTNIITNQKVRVYDLAVEKYMNLSNNLIKQLPQQPIQLEQMHHKRLERFVIDESLADAANCMEIAEYRHVYDRLIKQFNKRFQQIKDQNLQLRRNRRQKLYEQVENVQQIQENLVEITSESIQQSIEVIQDKIDIFIEQIIPQFPVRDLLYRIIQKFMETLASNFMVYVDEKENLLMEYPTKIQHLELEYKKLQFKNKVYEEKIQKLEERIIDLTELKNKFQQKYSEQPSQQPILINSQIMTELQRKNRDLEQELAQKNAYIEELGTVLQNFQIQFNKKYYKPKYSMKVNNLLTDINQKISDIYSTIEEVKKTDAFYEKINKEFQKQKQKINDERVKDKKDLAMQKAKFDKLQREKASLDEVIQQARKAINVMKNVEQQLKQEISSLQNRSGILSCLNATSQQKLSDFKQALQLTCAYIISGKGDKLKKFMKVTQTEQVTQIISTILKR